MIEPLHDYRIEVLHGYKDSEGNTTKVLGEAGAKEMADRINALIADQQQTLELLRNTQEVINGVLADLQAQSSILQAKYESTHSKK